MALPCVVAAPRGPGRAPPAYCAAERPEPVTPPGPALDHSGEEQSIEYPLTILFLQTTVAMISG